MSIALLKQFMQESGLSQNKVAIKLDVSGSTVSQYLAGKYGGDIQAIDKKVKELVERHTSRDKNVVSEFVQTATANKILGACKLAHEQVETSLIVAHSGLGKTTAVKQYAKVVDNVILIEVDPTYSTKAILKQLCKKLKMSDKPRANYEMMGLIVERLTGSDMLIIVDEAEYLSTNTFEVLRRIHDKARVGLVLCGLPRLRGNLRGRGQEFEQLLNRVGGHCDIEGLPVVDLEMMASNLMGTDKWNEQLIKLCNSNARRLNKLCRGVVRVSTQRNKPINEELIKQCAEKLLVS